MHYGEKHQSTQRPCRIVTGVKSNGLDNLDEGKGRDVAGADKIMSALACMHFSVVLAFDSDR